MEQFEILLNHGMDIKDMLLLCFKNGNQMICELEKGRNIIEILCENQKDMYFKNISFFAKFIPLQEAIKCAKDIEYTSNGFMKEGFVKSIYSIFIILFCFFMILFFDVSIVPSMSLYASQDWSINLLHCIKNVYIFIIVFVLFILFSFLILQLNPIWKETIEKYIFSRYFKSFVTLPFSYLFMVLSKYGLSSYESIETISKLPFSSFSTIISKELLILMNQGNAFNQTFEKSIFIDPSFARFFSLGFYSSKTITFIELYQNKTMKQHQVIQKKCIQTLQLFSYIMVGILVLLVYQIMLLPLNMLSTF